MLLIKHPLLTNGGEQLMTFVFEGGLTFLVSRSRTELGKKFNRWLHTEILPSIRKTGSYSIVPQTPQTYLEALKALVAIEEEKELLRIENEQLAQENNLLSEAVDDLFNYSSIIRVAKFNNVSEINFNWRKLKSASSMLNLEVKSVPCPRFQKKNLYSHDVWRYVYPDLLLPETLTLKV